MDQSARSEFAILHLDASEEKNGFSVEVLDFEIEEGLSMPFKCVIHFLSVSATLPFDDIVGRGAALSLHTGHVGERIWAGVCTELEMVNSEEHMGSSSLLTDVMQQAGLGGPSYKGRSRYKLTIEPDLVRLQLRRNSRIFQHKTAVEIVKEVLKDWDIQIDETQSKLTEKHPTYEYKVQYQETDFAFVSRILEDAGISYWIQPHPIVPTTEKKKGHEITKLILRDAPHAEKPTYDGKDNVLPYLGDGPEKEQHGFGPNIFGLQAIQQPKPLRVTMRDRDWRGSVASDPEGEAKVDAEGQPAAEGKYENFIYEPGAFWVEGQQSKENTPVADSHGIARTSAELTKKVPERRYYSELAGRTVMRFQTNTLDIEPGTVIQIGKDELGYDFKHPHPAFAPSRKLLVTRRKMTGTQTGSHYTSALTAVYAEVPYRPKRYTQKPRIFGVQSAVVVGPAKQEIYTDEFGRVRVQFPWDRYGKFDDKSSCWMRVSQAWAGTNFGFIATPRIGHEVLVAFFEGDPDQPVIVGRVYNAMTPPPYYPISDPNSSAKSGIKTDTSPHGKGNAGYNELSFQDLRGSEMIHMQAQKDLSFQVNNDQSHHVGSSLSYTVGKSESHHVGSSISHTVGGSESHEAGESFSITVGGKGGSTTFTMSPTSIVLSTGKAKISLESDQIHIEGNAEVHIHSTALVHMTSKGLIDIDANETHIDTEGNLLLNCTPGDLKATNVPPVGPASPPNRPNTGGHQPEPFLPVYNGKPVENPGALKHVNVGVDIEKAPDTEKKPAAPTAIDPLAKIGDAVKTGDVAKAADAAKEATKAAENTALTQAQKLGLPKFTADIPGMTQALRALHGADMTMEALSKNIGEVVTAGTSQFENWAKVVVAHIPEPVQDLLSSKLGQNFMNSAVTHILKKNGIPTSLNDVGAAAVDKMTKALGYNGNNQLSKAIFGGEIDTFKKNVTGALGKASVDDMIKNVFGGTSSKSVAGAAATATKTAAATATTSAAAKIATPPTGDDDGDG